MESFTEYRAHRRLPDLPLAAASILGFWLFYFATIVIRTLLIEESLAWLGYRALGCVIGIVLTFLVYFVLSRAARAERDAQAAQLKALRYQVNPHFLFNTLNSLSSLVMARRDEEAETMIVNLSTFFRSSLTLDPSEDVPLAQEIEFQRLYLDIEKSRFPKRLEVVVDVPPALRAARVPPLILQPLVENAI